MHEILYKHFRDPERIVKALYANGGLNVCGLSSVSYRYRGGIETLDDFHMLTWLKGFLDGLGMHNEQEEHNILKALNLALIEKFPNEVNENNCPFINLTCATI